MSFYLREKGLCWFYVGWPNGNAMHWRGTLFDAASVSQLKGVSTKIHFQLRGRRQVGFFVTWTNGKWTQWHNTIFGYRAIFST